MSGLLNATGNVSVSTEGGELNIWDEPWDVWAWKLSLDVGLIVLSGLFSGLTLGLLGLDTTSLQVVAEAGNEVESQRAKRILPLRRRSNLLLCTLLMGNVVVNSLLSILIADMTSGLLGLVLSTVVITLFGEILPMAACTKHALQIGAWAVPIVSLLMTLLYPIAKPIALILDWTLGKDVGEMYDKNELRALLHLHAEATRSELSRHEEKLLASALEFPDIPVASIMTGIGDVFMLEADQIVTEATKTLLWRTGHSRVPVYERDNHNVIGILFVKDLTLVEPSEALTVRSILNQYPRPMVHVFEDTKLPEVLKSFKTGMGHLAVVQRVQTECSGDPFYEAIGIVTLEDVIERLIQDEIVDETDVYVHIERRDHAAQLNQRQIIPVNAFQQHLGPLTDAHIAAIASFLSQACAAFSPAVIRPRDLEALVAEAKVCELVVEASDEKQQGSFDAKAFQADSPTVPGRRRHSASSSSNSPLLESSGSPGAHLYTCGVRSQLFTLILAGRVEVVSGQDGYRTQYGMWTHLGLRALVEPDFRPDFTARPVRTCKVLTMSRKLYRRYVPEGSPGMDRSAVPASPAGSVSASWAAEAFEVPEPLSADA
eukprot:EG_transcript_7279